MNDAQNAEAFRKSSHSGSGDCVQWRFHPAGVEVGDSKNPGGPTLFFTFGEWQAFLAGVRSGQAEIPGDWTVGLSESA